MDHAREKNWETGRTERPSGSRGFDDLLGIGLGLDMYVTSVGISGETTFSGALPSFLG